MTTLESILANTSLPQHPFVVVQHSLAAPAWPLVHELLRRGAARGPSLLVTTLNAPEAYLPTWKSGGGRAVDLSTAVPGFSDETVDVEAKVKQACDALPSSFQAFVDAADILSEDYSPAVAVRVVRTLLNAVKDRKAPSRLILALPASHPLTDDLISATFSPSLALLTPVNPRVVEHISRAYLAPADDSPRFWQLLETARARKLGDDLAIRAKDGVEVGAPEEQVVQVLLRKPTGGAKALVRALDGFRKAAAGGWESAALDQVVDTQPVLAPTETKRATTHADLHLPFNLQLTDAQKEARGAVPLPYAHQGEGADLGMGMDWSDDEEDEEI
ncbi:hypothetical protein Q8F55_006759 [Vanrija albida]|uniref:Elongator complex protein 5 n=1 Tax=Vanrija albida TaxID=181172 RepID=A0ABR3PY30_9TREE